MFSHFSTCLLFLLGAINVHPLLFVIVRDNTFPIKCLLPATSCRSLLPWFSSAIVQDSGKMHQNALNFSDGGTDVKSQLAERAGNAMSGDE